MAEQLVREELQSQVYMREEFPMLTTWGCPSDTIHSAGLNYLTAMGRHHGYWAISEYPVPNATGLKVDRSVRSDVCWFNKADGAVILLGEFEHYDPSAQGRLKIKQKAENLVIAHHQLPHNQRILLLAIWTATGIPVNGLQDLTNAVRQAFRDGAGNSIPALPQDCSFVTGVMVFRPGVRGMVFEEVLL